MAERIKEWLTVSEAAARLGVAPQTARNYADAGKVRVDDTEFPIRVKRVGPGRHRRMAAADIEKARQAIASDT